MRNMELFTDNLTHSENLEGVCGTNLGQAHFANTGPAGKTCRECSHWGRFGEGSHGKKIPIDPVYSGSHSDDLMHLNSAPCNYRIANKSDLYVPHDSGSCRFFEFNQSAPPATRERLRRRNCEVIDA